MSDRRYVIITPCRDEARFAARSLESVLNQTVPPALWIIVDDGSTDGTPEILAKYAAKESSIRIVRREDRGRRSVGPGVMDAFYAGLEHIDLADFPYLCKLDLDLELPAHYFETLMQRMEDQPRLGTCSGKAYYIDEQTGAAVSEMIGDEMSVGAAKFYRTACFEDIGGFVRQVMWDGIDCHRCRMLGWQACSWDEPALRFLHMRPMGSSQRSIWNGRARHGAGQYFMGTSLAYMTASALFRMTRPPRIVGGLAMWCGYMWSMLRRRPRIDDRQLRRFIRRYQWNALLRGKAGATRRIDQQRCADWRGQRAGETQPLLHAK